MPARGPRPVGLQSEHIADRATADAVRRLDSRVVERAVRVGTISFWGGNSDDLHPNDLLLIGQRLRVAQFPELSKIVGTRYGGDGINSFDLPDTRGTTTGGTANDPLAIFWTTYPLARPLLLTGDASTTLSILGSGSIAGFFKRWSNTVLVSVKLIPAADTGAATGETFNISLPYPCLGTVPIVGAAFAVPKANPDGLNDTEEVSGVSRIDPVSTIPGASRMRAYFTWTNGATFFGRRMSYAWPWTALTLGSGDNHADLTITYPVAEGGSTTTSETSLEFPMIIRAR